MSLKIKKSCKKITSTVKRMPYVSIILTLSAVLIHLSYSLRLQMLYDRPALLHHEFWRLLTCHWVHLSWDHLFWSAATFLVLGSLCEWLDRKKYIATAGISALLIPVALWWWMPGLLIYGGLSGLDCALYALLMVLLIKREIRYRSRVWLAIFLLLYAGLIAKITYETITGLTIFVSNSHPGMVPVPLAHLVGGIAGTVIGLVNKTASTGKVSQQGPSRHSCLPGSLMTPQ